MITDLRWIEREITPDINLPNKKVRVLQMRVKERIGNDYFDGEWTDIPTVKEERDE